MTIKPNIYLIVGIVCLLLTWLFVGLFRDGEFDEPGLFTKHRPTFKVNFYSPTGMSDLTVNDLTEDKQVEEIAFEEFVYKRNHQLWFLPFILIQSTLTLLIFGFYKLRQNMTFRIWQLPTHYIINVFFTILGVAFILFLDNIFMTIILMLVIIAINYLTILVLTRRKKVELYE